MMMNGERFLERHGSSKSIGEFQKLLTVSIC